jgi:AbrB family looped-hinge helix DNA binding protein
MVIPLGSVNCQQGRIVIPKEFREKYGLSDDGKLELVVREDAIELIPLTDEDDLAIRSLRDPAKQVILKQERRLSHKRRLGNDE